MKRSIFLILIFISIQIFAQNNYDGYYYYQGIAGDTAIYKGKVASIYKRHLGDTLYIDLNEGLYRILINPKINMHDDLFIKIMDEQGQVIATEKNDGYIEFINPVASQLRFLVKLKGTFESDVVGRTFWIYNRHVYKEAPTLALTDMEGNVYTNESLLDKVVVINFWGTRCGPCVREIPQLNKLVQQYAEREDVVFLAISVDTEERLKKFLEKKNFDYRLVLISKSYELERDFSPITGNPSHFVLNKEGKVVFQFFGEKMRIKEMLSQCIDMHI